MKCSLDRIEEGIAVLIPLDHPLQQVTVPVTLLPGGSREGDILDLALQRDPAATAAARVASAVTIAKLKKNSGEQ